MILDVTWLLTAVYSGHPFRDTALQFKKQFLKQKEIGNPNL